MLERHWGWVRAILIPLIVLAWTAVLIVLWWVLSHLTHALLVLILSSLVAFALTPLVNLIGRWTPRALAIAAAYMIGLLVILGLLGVVVATAATEIANLIQNLPEYSQRAQALEPQIAGFLSPLGIQEAQLADYRQKAVEYLQSIGSRVARDAVTALQVVLGTV